MEPIEDPVEIRRLINRLLRRIARRDDYGQLLACGYVVRRIENITDPYLWRSYIRRQARADRIQVRTRENRETVWAMRSNADSETARIEGAAYLTILREVVPASGAHGMSLWSSHALWPAPPLAPQVKCHDDPAVKILTQRLALRPFQPEDLAAFVAYRSDPEVARFQSWDPTYSLDDAERFLASQQGLAFGAPGEWVQLAAVDRVSGTLCGDCAVRVATDQPATAEVGVTFAPAAQGHGLASEAVAAVIARLFEAHDMHRIFAQVDDRNRAAHQVLERLGFRCEARLVEADWFKEQWTTLRIYAVLRRS